MTLTPEQLAMRRTGLGASEIPAVAGLSPYQTPLDVYLRKIGEHPDQDLSTQSDQIAIGHALERPIAELALARISPSYSLMTGTTLRHRQYAPILATPDFFLLDDSAAERALLQIKNVGHRMMGHWSAAEIPDYVRAQVEIEMAVTGLDHCYVGALLGGRDLGVYLVHAEPEIRDPLIEIAIAFWGRHVVPRDPPPIDGSDTARRWLQTRWRSRPEPIVATAEIEGYARALRDLEASMKMAETQAESLRNQIKSLMTDHAIVEGSFGRIRWAESNGGIDYKKIVDDMKIDQQNIDKYRRAPTRRFTALWAKEK